MRREASIIGFIVALAFVLPVHADEPQSGLALEAYPPAFRVTDHTGPAAGTTLCYRCRLGGRPVVAIFARSLSDELVDLLDNIDDQVAANEDHSMAAFFVYLNDEPEGCAEELIAFAEAHEITNVPMTTFQNAAGPGNYHISPDADVTVMMWVKSAVKVNCACGEGDLTAEVIAQISADTVQILQ